MAGFSGEATVKVDDKGRIGLPASIRAALEGPDGAKPALTIVYGGSDQKQLQVFSEASIAEVRARIDRLPNNALSRALRYLYQTRTVRVEVDGAGRMLLERKLRDDKLKGATELYLAGLGKTFEIWRTEDFEAQIAQDLHAGGLHAGVDPLEELDRALAGLGHSGPDAAGG